MPKQILNSFKWLPLAAIGILFPTASLWLFLWCLKLNLSFWTVYTVLYSSTIVSSLFLTLRKTESQRQSSFQEFIPPQLQFFEQKHA